MAPRTRSAKNAAAPLSVEHRTQLLPCMPPPPPPRPAAVQLAFPVALGQPDDQLVMVGCEDGRTDPHRVYRPPADPTTGAARPKDGAP